MYPYLSSYPNVRGYFIYIQSYYLHTYSIIFFVRGFVASVRRMIYYWRIIFSFECMYHIKTAVWKPSGTYDNQGFSRTKQFISTVCCAGQLCGHYTKSNSKHTLRIHAVIGYLIKVIHFQRDLFFDVTEHTATILQINALLHNQPNVLLCRVHRIVCVCVCVLWLFQSLIPMQWLITDKGIVFFFIFQI